MFCFLTVFSHNNNPHHFAGFLVIKDFWDGLNSSAPPQWLINLNRHLLLCSLQHRRDYPLNILDSFGTVQLHQKEPQHIYNYFELLQQGAIDLWESLPLLVMLINSLELVPERKTFPKIDDSFHLRILIPWGPFTSIMKPGGIFPFLPIFFNLTTSTMEPPSSGKQNGNHQCLTASFFHGAEVRSQKDGWLLLNQETSFWRLTEVGKHGTTPS